MKRTNTISKIVRNRIFGKLGAKTQTSHSYIDELFFFFFFVECPNQFIATVSGEIISFDQFRLKFTN